LTPRDAAAFISSESATHSHQHAADLRFEADYFRAALLVGLARETDVHDWAEALLHTVPDDDAS